MQRKLLLFALVASIGSVLLSCSKSDPPNPNVIFKATLNGASEVPANQSTATGTATLTFNKDTKIFTVVVDHTVSAPTAAHIHKGAAGTGGGVVFGFTSGASPINYTSAALTTDQETDLNAGLYYVNVHSAAPFGGGEIRGQLIKQ
jgi:hypothetical protein